MFIIQEELTLVNQIAGLLLDDWATTTLAIASLLTSFKAAFKYKY